MNENQLAHALEYARGCGALEAEAVMATSRSLELEVSRGELETLASSTSCGLGIRLFTADKRMGFAYTTSPGETLETTIRNAWENAAANDPEPYAGICQEAGAFDEDWSQQDPCAVSIRAKIAFTKDLEKATLSADKRIEQVEQASYSDTLVDFSLLNSAGVRRRYRNAYFSCSVVAVAAQSGADSERGWEFDFASAFEGLRMQWVAETCARDAARRLGGKPCATGRMPVVLDYAVATQFLQVLSSAFRADNVLKGKSFFVGQTGEMVGSELLSVVDQNDHPDGINRAPFDGEGTPAQRTVLLDNGRLAGYLHNLQSANEMGEHTTANASRGYSSPPVVGPTNLFIVPGPEAQEDLFSMACNGLFVTEAMGVHTADPISGDFSFGASGMLIAGGELTRPVRGVTIAGNIRPLLKAVAAVGNDLRFMGSCGAPSLLISELVVSGE
ncbi:MAG TPA: TldD/PmbA family protein [Candidatus Hydrogenedentes bacterium]|nr:TldD/PmbA family protein [Candidatus Hydrogenedentota bacterium]HQE82518.1 TldD/PmbA family protein [Candidatus Hydrogenedentota bacterium]HQH51077.1 TldD/PmbA family protein [Candidatus Hydrogenedentota bacterium]HQM47681.1 TldD/PmbA family protein [Candidatus Hydrogenedentota bacterium]